MKTKILSCNIDMLALFYCQKSHTGYSLMKQLDEDFSVRLGPGVVYSTLLRLRRDGLLTHCVVAGKRGTRQACSYTITAQGRAHLLESVQELKRLCQRLLVQYN